MLDANMYIQEHIKEIDGILVVPNIPEKKLNKAIKGFKCEDCMNSILALYDNTIFDVDEGLVFTGEKMIFRSSSRLLNIYYKDIQEVAYFEETVKVNEKKSKTTVGIKIITNEEEIVLKEYDLPTSIYKPLETFLQQFLAEVGDFKEANLLMPIEEMSSELKIAYVKIIINMAFENDLQIDEKELAEIISLIRRIELQTEDRFNVINYMNDISESKLIPVSNLVQIIKDNSEPIHHESLMISLAKDILNVHASTQIDPSAGKILIEDCEFLEKHQELMGISQEKIDIAKNAVENDFKILYEEVDDDMIKELTKDLAAKAASIGVPIGAVYLSGSVMGLSAAGITSGLATLGMGGILGFSGMVTGIGVAVLLGVGVYQGVKYLTKDDTLSRYRTRIAMLHDVIKKTQKDISLIISDINGIVKKLNEAIQNNDKKDNEIQKLMKINKQFYGALSQMSKKSNRCANIESRLQCARVLELSRISSIAEEPTKKKFYSFILSCYEEQIQDKEKQLVLKKELSTDKLETLSKALHGVGYFDTTNVLTSKVTSTISGWFK
ncbi:MAG: hypothetical protein HDT12_04440 [Helicobacter sp.]|nr:hypothetical protein [Helicobacter sp.]